MAKWQGRKHAGSHTSLIEAASPLVRRAELLKEVRKISPGYIKPTPGRTERRGVKFTTIRGGLLATVRSNTSVQEIRIYTNEPARVQSELEKIKL